MPLYNNHKGFETFLKSHNGCDLYFHVGNRTSGTVGYISGEGPLDFRLGAVFARRGDAIMQEAIDEAVAQELMPAS